MHLRSGIVIALMAAALLKGDANEVRANYDKSEFRIPMRDGVKLFTIVYAPKEKTQKYPFLIQRTPYSVAPYGLDAFPNELEPSAKFAAAKYIFVMQDVRGRYESEGSFVDIPILKDKLDGPKDTDESTDTYDTIEWLLKNVQNHNGKAGIYGTSYDGFYTDCALVRSHPALVAASPQAPMADVYMGDDAYHNGALFLAANFGFYTGFPVQKNPMLPEKLPDFDYGTKDGYEFYLKMGAVVNSDKKYLSFKNPYWTDTYAHTTYDKFWKPRNILPHLKDVRPAVMVVGGWFDAEDLSGTLKTYRALETASPSTDLHLVMGPWSHGAWSSTPGDKLGEVRFGTRTAEYFRDELEFPFFQHYLKGEPAPQQPRVVVFETGKNEWQQFASWPPPNANTSRLYLRAEGKLTFEPPTEKVAADTYESDSNHPVPYYARATTRMEPDYMVGDQRFLADRKDVLTYMTQPLTEDLTIAGPIAPTLFVSTTATDSDFDLKLIDVDPDTGYQQLVRGEPFRGKFRDGFEDPVPFKPGAMQKISFAMPDAFHCFRRGHRIMVQVQSSWFPLTDRNPQTFTDIPNASAEQFVVARESVFRSSSAASFVEINVVREGERLQTN